MTGRPRIDNAKAACNIIKAIRKYHKLNIIHKSISTSFKIDDISIANRTAVNYNILTGNISVSSYGISYKKICICPTVNQKLKCTNQHAIDVLNKNRKRTYKNYLNKRNDIK